MKVRVIAVTGHDTTVGKVYDVDMKSSSFDINGKPTSLWIIDDVGDEYYLYESEYELVATVTLHGNVCFKVGITGPDHMPTIDTKWYAQIELVEYDQIPVGLKTYAFGPNAETALKNLSEYLQSNGVVL